MSESDASSDPVTENLPLELTYAVTKALYMPKCLPLGDVDVASRQ